MEAIQHKHPNKLTMSVNIVSLSNQNVSESYQVSIKVLPYERFSFKVNAWNPKVSDIPQKFRISVVGLFPPVVVAALFPDQQRDIQIDYQPVTFTLYPKGDSFKVEKDVEAFQGRSGIFNRYRPIKECKMRNGTSPM
jgi:hypothetical protein